MKLFKNIAIWRLMLFTLLILVFSTAFAANNDSKDSKTTKVFIKAYLNISSGCQTKTTDLLDGIVKEYKGLVRVEYIDFGQRKGYERIIKDGLRCAGLVINDKQTHTFKDKNGKTKTVTFSHPIGQMYTADDVKAVVKYLLGN